MNKNLLIIRLDAIGDYILFRNFIKEIRKSVLYENYKIYLLCNSSWYDLACYLDKECIEELICFNMQEYLTNDWYKYSLIERMNFYDFEIIIHPTYSRAFVADNFINQIKAPTKIAYDGDLSNITAENKKKSDYFYTKLIPRKKKYNFEFERNKYFFEKVLNQSIKFKKPIIKLASNNISEYVDPSKKYVVLSIGASDQKRKWNIYNYIKIAQFIIDEMNLEVVLCGGTLELDNSKIFEYKIQRNFINLVDKVSLYEATKIINKSLFVISNDTGLAHISLALDKKTIVIMNGNHFGRFFPYPNVLATNFQCICPFDYKNKLDEFKDKFYYGSNLDINEISYNEVIDAIENIWTDNKTIRKKRNHLELNPKNNLLNSIKKDLNINFSKLFNNFYNQILKLEQNTIIYGNGTIGKTIQTLIPDKIIGYVDMADEKNHPKNLKNMQYDKIIISVMGREKEIIKYLTEELNVDSNKILTLEI